MAATQYMITTNGVDYGTRYTSKGRAVSEAETIGKVAAERAHGDVVTVQTVKTGKVVWTETYYTHNDGLKFGPVVEITGDRDVPACITTADGPMETLTGDQWDMEHAAYVESLKSDPAVMRMMLAADEHEARKPGYVGIMQQVPGFNATEHIHAAGCRDIQREMRKFGQSEGDTFPYPADVTVWNVIEENDGGRASDNFTVGTVEHAQEMVWNANVELRFMPCASIPLGMTPFGPLVMAEDGNYMISDDRTDTRAYVESLGLSESRVSGLDAESAFVDVLSPNGEPWGEMRNLRIYGNNEMFPAMLSMIGRDWDSFTLYDMGCYVVVGIIDPCKAGSIMSVLVWSARCENNPCEYAAPRVAEDAEALEYDALVDNIMDELTVDALLSVDVDGIKISLGWHTFTVKRGDERTIPTIYGEAHGEWNRVTVADWDSIITVEDSKTY